MAKVTKSTVQTNIDRQVYKTSTYFVHAMNDFLENGDSIELYGAVKDRLQFVRELATSKLMRKSLSIETLATSMVVRNF